MTVGAVHYRTIAEELLKYYQDRDNSATVNVQQSLIPSLIGAGGREMEKLRQETEALRQKKEEERLAQLHGTPLPATEAPVEAGPSEPGT